MILVLTATTEQNEINVQKLEGTLESYMDDFAAEFSDTGHSGLTNWRNGYSSDEVDVLPTIMLGFPACQIRWWEEPGEHIISRYNHLIIDIGKSLSNID